MRFLPCSFKNQLHIAKVAKKKEKKKSVKKEKKNKNQAIEKKRIAPVDSERKWEIKKISWEVMMKFIWKKLIENINMIIEKLKNLSDDFSDFL